MAQVRRVHWTLSPPPLSKRARVSFVCERALSSSTHHSLVGSGAGWRSAARWFDPRPMPLMSSILSVLLLSCCEANFSSEACFGHFCRNFSFSFCGIILILPSGAPVSRRCERSGDVDGREGAHRGIRRLRQGRGQVIRPLKLGNQSIIGLVKW